VSETTWYCIISAAFSDKFVLPTCKPYWTVMESRDLVFFSSRDKQTVKFSVQEQSRSDQIESDPVVIRVTFLIPALVPKK